MALALLSRRAANAAVCPSEVARALVTAGDWREAMPIVHEAIDRLVGGGEISLSWKGEALTARAGPYRIGRGQTGR